MKKIIDRGFINIAKWIIRFRIPVILACVLLTGALGAQLPKLTLDTTSESFLHSDDPARVQYDSFRQQFGSDRFAVIAIENNNPFTPEFLVKLKALHEDLENSVPYLDEVTSLINVRSTYGTKDELIVEDLLENWSGDSASLDDIRNRALSNPLYKNLLLSEDGKITTIVIRPVSTVMEAVSVDTDTSNEDPFLFDDSEFGDEASFEAISETVNVNVDMEPEKGNFLQTEHYTEFTQAIRDVLARHNTPEFEGHLAGSPVVDSDIVKILKKDNPKFFMLCFGLIFILLMVMFRRTVPVITPLLTMIMSTISTLGLMALCGTSFKLPTQIIPAFLSAVSVGGSVHILAIFYRQIRMGMSKDEGLIYAIGHSGLPVVLTSLTTAGGLISFAWADMAPISELGIYASAGVLLAMIYSIFFVPAVVATLPIKTPKETIEQSVLDRVLIAIGEFAHKKAKGIVTLTIIVCVLFVGAASQLKFSHFPLKWLPDDMPIRMNSEFLDDALKGTVSLEIIIDTERENGLYDIDVLKRLDSLADRLESQYSHKEKPHKEKPQTQEQNLFVGKAQSLTVMLKEIHQALNENNHAFYAIPDDPEIIPQEFLLFENSGSDDLEDYVDNQFSKARFTVKVPYLDAVSYSQFIAEIESIFQKELADKAVISSTGTVVLYNKIIASAMSSMAQSYIIAIIVITFLMVVLIGNLRIGLASMIPNLFPIIICLGGMSIAGMPLNMVTMLIGSVTLGIAVDDTIHFMHNYRRYLESGNSVVEAIRLTLTGTGRAMLFTTAALSSGFFVYVFASMTQMVSFGLLGASTILLALFADLIIAPALVTVMSGKQNASKKHNSYDEQPYANEELNIDEGGAICTFQEN